MQRILATAMHEHREVQKLLENDTTGQLERKEMYESLRASKRMRQNRIIRRVYQPSLSSKLLGGGLEYTEYSSQTLNGTANWYTI